MFDLWTFHGNTCSHLAEFGILSFIGRKLTPKKLSMSSNFFLQDQNLLFYGEFSDSTVWFLVGYFFP